MPIGSGNRIHDLYPKPVPFAERPKNIDVASPLPPETVIVSDQELTQSKPASQDELHKIFGRECRELIGKWQDGDIVEAGFRENLELLVMRGQQ
jgi:hypothetical protein